MSPTHQALHLGGGRGREALQIQQAVVLLSSQKTLPVAVTVLGKLTPAVGEAAVGLAAAVAVMAHLSQILVDSALVAWWLERHGRM